MAAPRTQRTLVALVGLAASVVFAWLALRHIDLASLRDAWRGAHPLPWVPLGVVCYLAGHLMRGQRLRLLVQRESVLGLPTASNIVVVGYASNNVFPARLGEFVRAGMLAERTGIPLSQSLTVTLIERLLDGISILILLVASAASLGSRAGWIWQLARVGSLIFGSALLVVLAAIFLPGSVLAAASRVALLFGPRGRDLVLRLATSIINGGACLRRPRDLLLVMVYSLAVWLLESGMFVFVRPVFSLDLALAPALIAMSVTNLGVLVPSTPGFVGPFHYFCSQALIAQGVPEATALSYAVVVHLAFFVPVTLWGVGAMLWYGVQVGATAAMARAARSSPASERMQGIPVHVIARLDPANVTTSTPELYVALTEAIVGVEGPAARAHVGPAADFFAAEIEALPNRLRAMFLAGMTMFRVYVRVRYFSSFCALDLPRKRAAVDSWAFGRIGLLRQLFRVVRSTTVLSYYETKVAEEEGALSRSLPVIPDAASGPDA